MQRTPQNWTQVFLGCGKVLKSYLYCLKLMLPERERLFSITSLLCPVRIKSTFVMDTSSLRKTGSGA